MGGSSEVQRSGEASLGIAGDLVVKLMSRHDDPIEIRNHQEDVLSYGRSTFDKAINDVIKNKIAVEWSEQEMRARLDEMLPPRKKKENPVASFLKSLGGRK